MSVEILPIKRFYLEIPKILGTKRPYPLWVLTEEQYETHENKATLVEIGTANPNLDDSMEWEITGVKRVDLVKMGAV